MTFSPWAREWSFVLSKENTGIPEVEINVGTTQMLVRSHRFYIELISRELDRLKCGQIESKNYFCRLLSSQGEFCTCIISLSSLICFRQQTQSPAHVLFHSALAVCMSKQILKESRGYKTHAKQTVF